MPSPPGSPLPLSSTSVHLLSKGSAKEHCEKSTRLPGVPSWPTNSKHTNPWSKRTAAVRDLPSSKGGAASTATLAGTSGASNKAEMKATSKQLCTNGISNSTVAAAGTSGSRLDSKSAVTETTSPERSTQQKADPKRSHGNNSSELDEQQFGKPAATAKICGDAKKASEASSLVAANTTRSTSQADTKDAETAADHALMPSESLPSVAHGELLKATSSPTHNDKGENKNTGSSNSSVNDSTSGSSSSNDSFDNYCVNKSTKAVSVDALQCPSAAQKCGFSNENEEGISTIETLTEKLRALSFQTPADAKCGGVLSTNGNLTGAGLSKGAIAALSRNDGGLISNVNSSSLLGSSRNNIGSDYLFHADALAGALSGVQTNSQRQLKEALFSTSKGDAMLSTVLREPAYRPAPLAANDLTAADVALAFPVEHSRHAQNSRECAFEGATGASAIAAAAVLAQQESRPLLLTRFEMLEAYAKGRLCLSCDSKSHRMPSCPYGEFVCPNCHRSSHRGEECPLRCRFCQHLHVGISVTVCIKRFRGPLEVLLGIPLPLRDLQPASLLSSGSPLSPFGPASCTRPNSAFGRSVYLSNLPPSTTQDDVAAAVESLVTKGRIMQVDLHEKHAFVQLSTLEAAFELVDKRRQLQIRGVTLKVQFKKTGVFNNGLSQGGAGGGVLPGGGVMHPSGSHSIASSFSPSCGGCSSSSSTTGAGGTHASASTPLSAVSSPAGGEGFTSEAATPKFSPSLNSLLIFLGPPAAPSVTVICAQVAAKLREDLQLGLVSAQQQSLVSSSTMGLQQQRSTDSTSQLKQQLNASAFAESFGTPLASSLLGVSGGSDSSHASSTADKSMDYSGATAVSGVPAAAAAAGSSGANAASELLSYGFSQSTSRTASFDNLLQRRLPYVDAAAVSAAAAVLQQQQQLLALTRQRPPQKTPPALQTENLLLQLLQQQHLEQQLQQQQQLAQQQQQRYGLGQPEDVSSTSSSSSSTAQELLLTETLMRAAAAAAAGRCMQGIPPRNSNNGGGYNARQQVQLQLRQQEQLQELQQQQQSRHRILQLNCSSSCPSNTSFLDAAAQEQQMHQRPRQAPDLREMAGLSSDTSIEPSAGGESPDRRMTMKGRSSSSNDNHKSGSNTHPGCSGSGFDLQFLLSDKSKLSEMSGATAALGYSRVDCSHISNSNPAKGSDIATEGGMTFASLQHPWNHVAAPAAAANRSLPAAISRLSALSNASLLLHRQQQQQQQKRDVSVRSQELQQPPLLHSSSSTPLSATTTLSESGSLYKRPSPHHLIDGPSTMSTDSGGLLCSSTAARIVAAADGKHIHAESGGSSKRFESDKPSSVGGKGGQHLQVEQQGLIAGACSDSSKVAETGFTVPFGPSSAIAAAEELPFPAKKQISSPLRGSRNSTDAERLTAAAVAYERGAVTPAAASAAPKVAAGVAQKEQAAQQLLDVAAVLMRKAMEETSDVDELAQQLYHATQDLSQETVQQLLLTLASNGWGASAATSAEDEEGEEEEERDNAEAGSQREQKESGSSSSVRASSSSSSFLV